MIGECDCCRTVQPDVHALGELGHWCDTCACETGGCLHAATDDLVDPDMARRASRWNAITTWERSDQLHKQLGSTVRNHNRAWTGKPPPPITPPTDLPAAAIAGWWNTLRELVHA